MQVDTLEAALRKVFQNMSVTSLLALPDLLPSLVAGLQHPSDGVRDVAAFTVRRVLLNLAPLYQQLSTTHVAVAGGGSGSGGDGPEGVPSAAVARRIVDTPGLLTCVGLCVADSRIQVSDRACDVLVGVAAAAAATHPDVALGVAHAVAHVAGAWLLVTVPIRCVVPQALPGKRVGAVAVCVGACVNVSVWPLCLCVVVGSLPRARSAAVDAAVAEGQVDPSVMAVRVFDVTTRLVAVPGDAGASMFVALSSLGLVGRLCDAVTGDDPLLQMNILHFVPRVGACHAGALFLEERGG